MVKTKSDQKKTVSVKTPKKKGKSVSDPKKKASTTKRKTVAPPSSVSSTPPSSNKKRKVSAVVTPNSGSDEEEKSETETGKGRAKTKASKKDKGDEEIVRMQSKDYVKKDLRTHILDRPGMYVGAMEKVDVSRFLLNDIGMEYFDSSKEKDAGFDLDGIRMEHHDVTIVPALKQLWDELIVNAVDHYRRNQGVSDIKVTIDEETGIWEVINNGMAIPCEFSTDSNTTYVPEMIFFHLLSGTNYDDTTKRHTGGRNGYGAKLCAIFAEWVEIKVKDTRRGVVYEQRSEENNSIINTPKISKINTKAQREYNEMSVAAASSSKKVNKADQATMVKYSTRTDYVSIRMKPDYKRFDKMKGLDKAHVRWMMSRVIDLAAGIGKQVSISLNGRSITSKLAKGFKPYMALHVPKDAPTVGKMLAEEINDQWQVGVMLSSQDSFVQTSFVNSICTTRGGDHVQMITEQLVSAAVDLIKKRASADQRSALQQKIKSLNNVIRRSMHVFINCLISNPDFDSQTKEHLTSKRSSFDSRCELPTSFVNRVLKELNIIENINAWFLKQEEKDLKKSGAAATGANGVDNAKRRQQLTGIPKLEDAHDAGTARSKGTTLILCEGDSAKALVMAGLSVLGRDKFGVFPLRGKLLNVREATPSQVAANAEVQAIVRILGLQYGKVYKDTSSLRYESVCSCTDADADGSHILALVLNLFHHFWPSLFKLPNFLSRFITPVIVATPKTKGAAATGKRGGAASNSIGFFSVSEYNVWMSKQQRLYEEDKKEKTTEVYVPSALAKKGFQQDWNIKYYKGLGTSSAAEAKQYFRAVAKHLVFLSYNGTPSDDAMVLAMDKKKADARKDWVQAMKPGTFLEYFPGKSVHYEEFVHKDLILFSHYSNVRALPSVVDGLKVGQRKIIYYALQRNLTHEIKVAQLGAAVAEKLEYHHGEVSLVSTIVGMAQSFWCANNVNLLYPSGTFGTRMAGGSDAASGRYIFTRLSKITRLIFPAADDPILTYLEEDGRTIEPANLLPIVPMLLVNGANGIGTGFSTFIPPHSLRDTINSMIALLDDKDPTPLSPYYRHFIGGITALSSSNDGGDDGEEEETGRQQPVYRSSGLLLREPPSVGGKQNDIINFRVTELPVGYWTNDYKALLITKLQDEQIHDFQDNSTDTTVDFSIQLTEEQHERLCKKGVAAVPTATGDETSNTDAALYGSLGLLSTIHTTNMVAWNGKNEVQRYDSTTHILRDFYAERLAGYVRRREHQMSVLQHEIDYLKEKCNFIQEIIVNTIVINNVKISDLVQRLVTGGYRPYYGASGTTATAATPLDTEEDADAIGEGEEQTKEKAKGKGKKDGKAVGKSIDVARGYRYLIDMPMSALTAERFDKLQKEKAAKESKLEELRQTNAKQLWRQDLDALLQGVSSMEAEDTLIHGSNDVDDEDEPEAPKKKTKGATTNKKTIKPPKKAKSKSLASLGGGTLVVLPNFCVKSKSKRKVKPTQNKEIEVEVDPIEEGVQKEEEEEQTQTGEESDVKEEDVESVSPIVVASDPDGEWVEDSLRETRPFMVPSADAFSESEGEEDVEEVVEMEED